MVVHHTRWLACRATDVAGDAADAASGTNAIPFRRETNLIAASQPGAGAIFDVVPDGSFANAMTSAEFVVAAQLHLGYDISEAKSAYDQLEALGDAVDPILHRKGDRLENDGERTRTHNNVLNVTYDMVTAAAVGQVVKGDKEQPELTDMFNAGYIVDVAEVGGCDVTGADVSYEVKVPSPFAVSAHQAGRGTCTHGGAYASVGHLYALGNTEERYRVKILGAKSRGRPGTAPLDHATGLGWVKGVKGDYDDALRVKRGLVIPVIIETRGGLSRHARARVSQLAARVAGANARDGTKYGKSTFSPRRFYAHWTRRAMWAVS